MLPLRGLVPNESTLKLEVEEVLNALIGYGDLLEHDRIAGYDDDAERRLLYAAPPSFVLRESGSILLIGIAPEHNSSLPDELEPRVQYINHVRFIEPENGEDLADALRQLGHVDLPLKRWAQEPQSEAPEAHLRRLDSLLDNCSETIEIPGLRLLIPERSPRYDRGRWADKIDRDGRFVSRRPQAYGADLWCYGEVRDGRPTRFLDLPLPKSRERGCDEAWRLQSAIDFARGAPQQFRTRSGPPGHTVIDLFSPIPRWAQRRWDSLGDPVSPSGCLLSYRFGDAELPEEIGFAQQSLWLSRAP